MLALLPNRKNLLLAIAALACIWPVAAKPDEPHSWASTQTIRKKEDVLTVVEKMSANMNDEVSIKIKGKLTPKDIFDDLNRKYYFDYATAYWYYYGSGPIKFIIKPADNAVLAAAFHKRTLKKKLTDAEARALQVATDCINRTISKTMTRQEKVLALHDAIAEMCNYDYANTQNQSCVSVLLDGKGACGAYARTLWLMLNMIDIPCHIIQGSNNDASQSPHAWALVQMDGNAWYHVDVCKDDSNHSLTHRLFAVTDEEMAKFHHWDKAAYPATPAKSRKQNTSANTSSITIEQASPTESPQKASSRR